MNTLQQARDNQDGAMKSDAQIALDKMSRDCLETAVRDLSAMVARRETRYAELERMYVDRCREIITLQGANDRFRAGLEKVRELEASLRKRPDVAAPWVSLDLAAALDLAGVE